MSSSVMFTLGDTTVEGAGVWVLAWLAIWGSSERSLPHFGAAGERPSLSICGIDRE